METEIDIQKRIADQMRNTSDLMKFHNGEFSTFYGNRNDFKKSSILLKAITTHSANQMRLNQIIKSANILSSVALVTYNIEGKIVTFDMHPSLLYLLILSTDSYLYVFKITNGEIQGKISVNSFSSSNFIE